MTAPQALPGPRGRAFPLENLVPLLAGLFWLVQADDAGWIRLGLGVLPGTLLLAGATAIYLLPGDLRAPQTIALGSVLGVLLSLPIAWLDGPLDAAILLALALASFVACGWTSQRREPRYERVPEPPIDTRLALGVGLDQLALASMMLRRPDALGERVPEHAAELARALELWKQQGWLEKPASYHVEPPALDSPEWHAPQRAGAVQLEHLSFASGYEPHEGEPGRERWLGYEANRRAHAWLMRRGNRPGPWLICVHGYGMGDARFDRRAFDATRLQREFGLNLIFPVLPLHGPRKTGWRSGNGYLTGDFLNTVHAHAQAVFELRRLSDWLRREQGATAIGSYGLSLGSGVSALLACLDPELRSLLLGIPAVDLTRAVRRQASPGALRAMNVEGLDWDDIERVLSVICALDLEPRVASERVHVFAGTADHLITPDQVRDLQERWHGPEIAWYAGSHLSFPWAPEVRRLIDRSMHALTS